MHGCALGGGSLTSSLCLSPPPFGNSLEVSIYRLATCKWIPHHHSRKHTCVSCRVFNRSVAMSASFVRDNSNRVDRSTPLVPESPLSFPDICARIHDRISTFLTEETNEQILRNVQEQTRISLRVISDALDRYRYILTFFICCWLILPT